MLLAVARFISISQSACPVPSLAIVLLDQEREDGVRGLEVGGWPGSFPPAGCALPQGQRICRSGDVMKLWEADGGNFLNCNNVRVCAHTCVWKVPSEDFLHPALSLALSAENWLCRLGYLTILILCIYNDSFFYTLIHSYFFYCFLFWPFIVCYSCSSPTHTAPCQLCLLCMWYK